MLTPCSRQPRGACRSTACRWGAAGARSTTQLRAAPTRAASTEVAQPPSSVDRVVARRRRRRRARPTPRPVRRAPRPSVTAGCCSSIARPTAAAGTFTPPLMITSSARPVTRSRPSSSSRPRSSVRNQPSRSTDAGPLGLAVVPVEEHRPAQQHLAVVADPHLDAVERAAVVHAAAAGLAHPVGLHDRGCPAPRPRLGSRGVERAAADEHGVEAGRAPRSSARRRAAAHQLGRHERDVAPRPLARPAESGRTTRLGPGDHRAVEHLHPGDVRRRQVEHPLPRTAEPRVRGQRRGPHRVAGEHAPASARRSTRGRDRRAAREPSAASHSRSSARISSARAGAPGRRLLTRGHAMPCHNPGHGATAARADAAQWVDGARPRTLPAAVAPVLAGTGIALCGATRRSGGRRVLALVVALAAAGRGQLRQRLLRRRSAAPTTTGSARCGWSVSGVATPAAVKRAAFLSFGVGRRASASCSPRPPPGGWSASALLAHPRRLVLHRRLAALRLRGPRRGDGVRVLRAGRGRRHDVRPDRDASTLPALVAAIGDRLRSPARSWSPTTCATSRPTPRPASAPSPWCSATSAPGTSTALLVDVAVVALIGVALDHHLVGPARAGRLVPAIAARAALVLGGSHRAGPRPGAAADRRRRAALRRGRPSACASR